MAEHRNGEDSEIPIDSLLSQVKTIESVRTSQTLLRVACLGVVFGLIGLTGVTVYGSYKKLDAGKYTDNLQKELRHEFQPDLERLAAESERKLLPTVKNHLEKSLQERLPKLQARYESLAHAKVDEVAKKFDASALVYFREFESALRKEIPDQDLRLVFEKLKRTEDRIAGDLLDEAHLQMGALRPQLERIQAALRALGEKPEVRDLSFGEAKELLLDATIDLLKYELLQGKGNTLETVSKSDKGGQR